MTAPQPLRVYALGPAQVWRGDQPLSAWDFLEARELLYYFLCYTGKAPAHLAQPEHEHGRGKTKEQIGLDFWPNASPAQLNSNLKSRLFALRQALGGRDWIVYDDGLYMFNPSLDYWFDVDVFERNLGEAKRVQAQSPEQAIAYLQEAIGLYH